MKSGGKEKSKRVFSNFPPQYQVLNSGPQHCLLLNCSPSTTPYFKASLTMWSCWSGTQRRSIHLPLSPEYWGPKVCISIPGLFFFNFNLILTGLVWSRLAPIVMSVRMALISGDQPLSAGTAGVDATPRLYGAWGPQLKAFPQRATSAALPSLACSFKVKFTVFILIFITFSFWMCGGMHAWVQVSREALDSLKQESQAGRAVDLGAGMELRSSVFCTQYC